MTTDDDVDTAIAALDRRWRALETLVLAALEVLLLYTIISLLWG